MDEITRYARLTVIGILMIFLVSMILWSVLILNVLLE